MVERRTAGYTRVASPTSHALMRRNEGRDGFPRAQPQPDVRPVSSLHVHWFRRLSDDPFSGAVLYACRCGVVRSGF